MQQKIKRAIGDNTMTVMAAENQNGSHPVPIEPALLDWAEYWYPISWKGVLLGGAITAVGACATIAFLLLQWRTTSIREEYSEWRTSTLELQTEEAKKETAEAQERAAEAWQKAEEEKFERVKIEQEMLKQLFPRDLTKQQVDDIVSVLKGKVNKKLSVHTLTDSEASSFGLAIMHALTEAGIKFDWIRPTVEKNVFFVPENSAGLTLYAFNVQEDQESKQLVQKFVEAFTKAGVQIGAYMPEKSLPGAPSPSLFISKRQPPFSWFPEYVAPAGLPKPPWGPK